jgi:hypothetical protein
MREGKSSLPFDAFAPSAIARQELSPRLSLRRAKTACPRAYASQLARSVKGKRVKGLRGKTKMVERRISV